MAELITLTDEEYHSLVEKEAQSVELTASEARRLWERGELADTPQCADLVTLLYLKDTKRGR